MPPTIGVDLASVDENTPGYATAKSAGVRSAILRAIYGRPVSGGTKHPFVDPIYARDKNAVRSAGLKLGAYLFVCMPRAGFFTPQPEEQADAFIEYVDLQRDQDLVPMFDVEEESTLDPEAYYKWIYRVAIRLRDHYQAWPGAYTSGRVWNEYLHGHPAGELEDCPLWLAKPWPWAIRTPAHLDGAPAYSPNLIPAFGNQWFLYQYQGDAINCPGFNKTVDLNRWRVFGQGAKGDHVKWAQRRLKKAVDPEIIVDGDFGPMTKAGTQLFQSDHGLTSDGIIGLDTFTSLAWVLP